MFQYKGASIWMPLFLCDVAATLLRQTFQQSPDDEVGDFVVTRLLQHVLVMRLHGVQRNEELLRDLLGG